MIWLIEFLYLVMILVKFNSINFEILSNSNLIFHKREGFIHDGCVHLWSGSWCFRRPKQQHSQNVFATPMLLFLSLLIGGNYGIRAVRPEWICVRLQLWELLLLCCRKPRAPDVAKLKIDWRNNKKSVIINKSALIKLIQPKRNSQSPPF